MNQLLTELAKMLHLGNDAIQNLANNYPQIREQYIAWQSYTKIIDGLTDFDMLIGVLIFISAVVFLMSFFYISEEATLVWTKYLHKYARRFVIGSILTYLLLHVAITALQIIRVNTAPEIDAIVKIVEKDK